MKKNSALIIFISWLSIFAFSANASAKVQAPTDFIQNVTTTSGEESFTVFWNIDYEAFKELEDDGYTVSIKYNTEVDAKRAESGYNESSWKVIKDIDLHKTKYQIKNLKGGETYVVKVGVANGVHKYWSDAVDAESERGWGIFRLLVIIGSLGLFIYGMKIMSEGIQQAAGQKLRNLLGSITSNRFKGVLTGFGITSIVQSSSVTTVMTVSFVNAGLFTLLESTGVIMGANIGTTVTGWIINIFGFEMDIASYVLILIAIVTPFLFIRGRPKWQARAYAVMGFCLFFIGLGFLKEAVPTLTPDSPIVRFFYEYKDIPVLGVLLFVFLGTLVTVIVQSSSAAMALTMTLVASGILPFEVASAMILGENIGTTITAQLAAIVGNVHAKRAAWIHTLFNLFGVFWVILIFPFFLELIKWFMVRVISTGNPFLNPQEYANTGLVIFHSAFNILNVLFLVWFAPFLVRLTKKIVKPKGDEDEEFRLDYIGSGIITSADLALLEVKKEVAKFGELTSRMSTYSRSLLLEKSKKKQRKTMEKIAKYEEITDRVEIEVANYLNKITEGKINIATSRRIRGMNSIAGDLERIGDIFYQISMNLKKKEEENIVFSKVQIQSLVEMFDLVDHAFQIMSENLSKHLVQVDLKEAYHAEDQINSKRDELKNSYLHSLSENENLDMQGIIIYQNIYSSLERVGDHIINVSEGVTGKI